MKKIKQLLFADNYPTNRNVISAALYCISLLGLDLGMRFIYKDFNTSPLSNTVPFLFTCAWVALLTAISFVLPRLARRIYQIATVVLYGIITLIHGFFISFFGSYMTMSSAIFAQDGADFFEWSYFPVSKKLLLLIFVAVLLAVLSALIAPKTEYRVIRVVAAIAVFACSIGGVFAIRHTFLKDEGLLSWSSTRPPVDIYESFTDTNACMHMTGLYQYTFRDFLFVSGLNNFLDSISNSDTISELDAYYSEKEIDPDNEMTGIFGDKNLLLIQLESIDTWMTNEISMPFLTQLRSKSIDFSEFYAPKFLYASTYNTEFLVNTGLIPPINSSKTSYFTDNAYPYSLANLFKKAGYDTESYHRSNGNIYNRASSHVNWGYNKYNTGFDMKMANVDLDTSLMDGYDMFVKNEKFMSFIITYSGHGPYNGDSVEAQRYYDIIKPQLPADAEDEYVWALCHAYETDQFIKQLYEKLESEGRLKDTVLMFYSDHYDHYLTGAGLLEKYKGSSESDLWCKVPCFIYSEGTPAQTISKVVSSYDILPTLVNLFGLESDGRYYVGNDAFSEGGGYVFFKNNSWYNGETYYNTTASTGADILASEISKKLNASLNTIKIDYFKE